MNCALHKTLPLQYFCQTCLDPICAQCIKSNPHSNQFHQILSIQQAVDIRKQAFSQYVQQNINPLRQKMRQKLQELKSMQSKQVQKRNIILKDIMLQFQAIDQRTRQKSQKSILQRQTQIKYYQSYLNSLDDLAYTFQKTSMDPYNLLILYQDFTSQLKSLQLKEIKERIDQFQIMGDLFDGIGGGDGGSKIGEEEKVVIIDPKEQQFRRLEYELNLPREIKTTLQQVSKLPSLRQRNDLLNALIATACQNYQKQQKKCKTDAQTKYKTQLHIFNHANQNIIKLNVCKSCAFCGLSFTLDQANDQCLQNKSIKMPLHDKYLSVDVPVEFRGTKRHYWVDSSLSSRNVPDHNTHSMLRPVHKKAFMSSLKDLEIVKCCFRKYEIDHANIDTKTKTATISSFIKVFEDADKQKKGVLSKITFKYLLTKTFEMNPVHGDILTQLLSYNWMPVQQKKPMDEPKEHMQQRKLPEKLQPIDGVNYRLLKDLMENPLFPYEQWERIQQENDKSKPHAPKSQDKGGFKYGVKR